MPLELLRDQVGAGDRGLLVGGVAGELDDLQAVAQRGGHGAEIVRGAEEDHLGEVEGELQVVVDEGPVLLGVEDLQQGGLG